jgi:hypothetical protein
MVKSTERAVKLADEEESYLTISRYGPTKSPTVKRNKKLASVKFAGIAIVSGMQNESGTNWQLMLLRIEFGLRSWEVLG